MDGTYTITGSLTTTTPVVLLTGSPGWFITGVTLQASGSATTGSQVDVTCHLDEVGGLRIFQGVFTLNTAPSNQFVVNSNAGYCAQGKISGSNVTIALDNSLTTGSITYVVSYGYTSAVV
jgi:hypothetical protein